MRYPYIETWRSQLRADVHRRRVAEAMQERQRRKEKLSRNVEEQLRDAERIAEERRQRRTEFDIANAKPEPTPEPEIVGPSRVPGTWS